MKARRAWLGALALTAALAAGADAARITGVVVDAKGQPVPYASVAVRAARTGAVADAEGRFTLDLPDGPAVIEVAQLGYRAARIEWTPGAATSLRVELAEEAVPLDEVTVDASAFGARGKAEGAVVRRIDVYTTPGAAADLFQAIRTLPGLNAPAEGAALYVRGGDPRETAIRLDGAPLGHPYHSESASGGLFSVLDTYLIRSAYFSSGGFPARYGGAMSGVLDIETEDPMNLRTVTANANLVGGGLSGAWTLVPDRLSLIGTVRSSTPALLFRLYGSPSEFQSAPVGSNGFGRMTYRYSPTGRLSLSYLEARDRVAVEADALNITSVFSNRVENRLVSLQARDVVGKSVALRASAWGQWFDTRWSFDPFGGVRTERLAGARVEGVASLGSNHELTAGADLDREDVTLEGRYAADSTDLGPGAPTRVHAARPVRLSGAFHVEDKLRVWGPLYASLGGRLERLSAAAGWRASPRAALAWRLDDRQTLRVAGGRYRQAPDAEYLDPVYGNPDLDPAAADHVIVGYEWKSDDTNVRLEVYRKDYRGLVANGDARFYDNSGHGYARGVDALVHGRLGRVSGWATYGLLDARRRELADTHEAPSAHGVRHSLILVGKLRLTPDWELGGKYHARTGTPYTPVVGATYDSARAIWHPIEGDERSATLPAYHRLDLRLTRLFALPAGWGLPPSGVCVLYVEALNALGIRNVLEYVYSADYTERRAVESYFSRRYLVAGVSLSW